MAPVSRRVFVSAAAIAALLARSPLRRVSAKEPGLRFGRAKPFSFDALVERARVSAGRPYQPPYRPAPALVSQIDYEAHGKLHYKTTHALDVDGPDRYPTTFFHLGQYFPKSVKMHDVQGGHAREVLYSPEYFDMPKDALARRLPGDSGFAGLRLHESKQRADWRTQDWVAFLGASYVRAIGALNQYGLSARGVAVNTTAPGLREEFPDFTELYVESPTRQDQPVNVYALLDGPSISGAFYFACQRNAGVVMDVTCALFLRAEVAQLGIAPMTSMFWYSEYDKSFRVDWRPEVHDSDGLALWTGTGERIWRPLNNPSRVITSSFSDDDPRGFGLLQRDRVADHYLDGVRFERRPSLWVEPLGAWGLGAVALIEIPTDDEIHDNVVAFWMPHEPAKKGASYRYRYRLHWQADEPYRPPTLARVVATRLGRGGQPGRPRPRGVTKFVVELEGEALETLATDRKVEARVSSSRGSISDVFTESVPDTRRKRAHFDLTVSGSEPVELRLYLLSHELTLSETWAYQFEPRG
jgi:glucans biosynthesis protein